MCVAMFKCSQQNLSTVSFRRVYRGHFTGYPCGLMACQQIGRMYCQADAPLSYLLFRNESCRASDYGAGEQSLMRNDYILQSFI